MTEIGEVLDRRAKFVVLPKRSEELIELLPDGCVNLLTLDIPYFGVKGEEWDNAWPNAEAFLGWVGEQADLWRRVLAPNGTIYVFASPQMAWGVEGVIRQRFEILSHLIWAKEVDRGKHAQSCKDELRNYFPNTERIFMAEHFGADRVALNRSGYAARCEEARGFVFEPLRAYLDGERNRAGLDKIRINVACGFSASAGGMASRHYFSSSQWQLPTREHYEKIRALAGPGFFERPYEALREEYEALREEYEALREEYEALRRPFSVSANVPYTDVWTYPTVPHYEGKHPCEKPEDMARDMIAASSRPDDVIADFYCGSGVFLASAVAMGRRAIGGDMDPYWSDFSRKRCEMAQITGKVEVRKIVKGDPRQTTLF